MAQVVLKNIDKSYGITSILKNISLKIKDGEFVVFVGPSGCGKSTLLRLIAGLTDATDGEIHIGDKMVNDVSSPDRKIAMVFQSYALYPHMSVAENMGFSLRMAKKDDSFIDKQVRGAAKILQLEKLLDRKPKALSGGQRQRVAIGRAIVREPQVFLFDEPLSNLDAELRVDMRVQIAKIHRQLDTTMIYVTHDQVEAMTMADKIVVLRDGTLQQVGSPLELYHYPHNFFVAGFIGSPKMNFFEVECKRATPKEVEVVFGGKRHKLKLGNMAQSGAELQGLAGSTLMFGVRPKAIKFAKASGKELGFSGEIEVMERLGGLSYAYVKCPLSDKNIVTEIGDDVALKEDDKVNMKIDPADCYLFTPKGIALKRLTKFTTYDD